MKKGEASEDELRSEYKRQDFGEMVRGKYARRVRRASNVVVLEPEVAQAFPNSRAVNDALKGLIEVARRTQGRTRGSSSASSSQPE